MKNQKITIYHSPDADDAFMFYGLVAGAINEPGYEFHHELSDIESLNHRALRGELDVTAVSVHAFAYIADKYSILISGSSMGGENYGPRLVAKKAINIADGKPRNIAIPGEFTSAALALRIYLREKGIDAELINIHFDNILEAISKGEVDAGVIIHEGQITSEREGFVILEDLGKWWWNETKLPLPLGVNVVKKDLGQEACKVAQKVLLDSINYSLSHREEALKYALTYGRGISYEDADTFVQMYVNDRTVDLGKDGKKSIKLFLEKGREYGFVPPYGEIGFV